jgi:dihydroneopterin aldolase
VHDTVFIEGLRIDTIIGVFEWERLVRQTLVFDLSMQFDCAQAGISDDVDDALNYAEVSTVLTEYVEASRFELIEALAESCCELLLEQFNVQHVQMRLKKPGAVPKAITVGVNIQRSRAKA